MFGIITQRRSLLVLYHGSVFAVVLFSILALLLHFTRSDTTGVISEPSCFDQSCDIPPIPCRDDFATVAEHYLKQTNRAAEIGVFQGKFAKKNVAIFTGDYHMIDAWQYRAEDASKDYGHDKNFKDAAVNEANMEMARVNALSVAGNKPQRVHVIQSFSVPAADMFPDSHFDWLYIDAMHDYENALNDMHAWWPKLRPGGLFSGDDYGDYMNTTFLSAQRFSAKFGPVAIKNKWGVQRAVQDFSREKRVTIHVTWANDCYHIPAWYIFKPNH